MTEQPKAAFAALGHQDSWRQIHAIVEAMRPASAGALSIDELRTIVPWIPPRTVSRFTVARSPAALRVGGVYIDTFFSPDDLTGRPTRQMLERLREAVAVAEREGVALVTLGGFTSILLESERLGFASAVPMTTGNTLTAALIIAGVDRALALSARSLSDETLLIIGASGDVGSACAAALAGRTRGLLLAARNPDRLEAQARSLRLHAAVEWSTDVNALLGRATLIISAASTARPAFDLESCHPQAIVCDAGYPKNMSTGRAPSSQRLFWGGMGRLAGGLVSSDGNLEAFYRFPLADVAHGCMIEGAVLAMAGRFESFSRGRGNITPGRVDEMWRLAGEHGVAVAPLFDGKGLWPEEVSRNVAARSPAGERLVASG